MKLAQLLPSLASGVRVAGCFQAGQPPGESLAGGLSAHRLRLRAACTPVARVWQAFTQTGAEKSNEQACVCDTHGLLVARGREGSAEALAASEQLTMHRPSPQQPLPVCLCRSA